MKKKIRGIITALNATVSILLTELIMRYLFVDVGGIRVVIIAVAVAICLFKALDYAEAYYIHREVKKGNEKENGQPVRKGEKDNLPGKPWYEMRYTDIIKGNGNR